MTDELKPLPCPFCPGQTQPVYDPLVGAIGKLRCPKCNAFFWGEEDEIRKQWNTRPEPPEVAELKAVCRTIIKGCKDGPDCDPDMDSYVIVDMLEAALAK